MLLGSETDFTAMRAWKILQRIDELAEMGVDFPNLRGFVNLAASAHYGNFELLPVNMSPGPTYLHSDFILPLRHTVRSTLDRHASMSPDGKSWVDVERETTYGHFGNVRDRPVFFSRVHRAHRELLACVESISRPWWVQCNQIPESGWHYDIVFGILEMVLGWLVRLVPVFEERNVGLPPDPVTFRVRFPAIETFHQRDNQLTETPVAPKVAVEDGEIAIDCVPRYLSCFLSPGNLGDRQMIVSLVRGVDLLCGNQALSESELEEWVYNVVGSESAHFFKMTPSQTPEDVIYDVVALPKLRLLMPEDRAWSRINLARRAGYEAEPGPIPSSQVGALLKAAVNKVWQRVRSRLVDLSRESVIERSLLNYVATRKEHRDWLRSTAAQFALHDHAQVNAAASERVLRRDTTGLACRIITEMAVCTSPYGTGSPCTGMDLDFLVAEVATLLECAGQSDALHFGLATGPPIMHPNGSFGFDASAVEATGLLMTEHWRRTFRDAAKVDEAGGEVGDEKSVPDPEFPAAFIAEFGLSLEQYAAFVQRVTLEALELNRAHLRLRKSEVVRWLGDVGAMNPQCVFEALRLFPGIGGMSRFLQTPEQETGTRGDTIDVCPLCGAHSSNSRRKPIRL